MKSDTVSYWLSFVWRSICVVFILALAVVSAVSPALVLWVGNDCSFDGMDGQLFIACLLLGNLTGAVALFSGIWVFESLGKKDKQNGK